MSFHRVCRVLKKNGKMCKCEANHEYAGRALCERHWNNGRLTKSQPADEVVEARRRIRALAEIPGICAVVIQAVVNKSISSYNDMAYMTARLARINGDISESELCDTIRLITTTVKLRRTTSKQNEAGALNVIGTMIYDMFAD